MTEPVRQPLVLVADDDAQFREQVLPHALSRINARVLTATTVADACRLAVEHGEDSNDPLDLVVLDMHLPLHESTGAVASDGGIQFLRSAIPFRCPVVVFTAYPSFRGCTKAIQEGASAYVPKMAQDVYTEGPEGGIDSLVATCRRLLEDSISEERAFPPRPEPAWIQRNFEWLRQQFGATWVAFIDRARANQAGIVAECRDDYCAVSRQSQTELRAFLATIAPYLGYLPEVVWVPSELN